MIRYSGLFILFTAVAVAQNGITVGKPKVFDNRTLSIQLEQLESDLRALRFVDQAKITGAVGTFQGLRSTDISTSWTVGPVTLPPAAAAAAAANAAGADGNSSGADDSGSGGATSPSASMPALPDLIASPSFSPTYSLSAHDMLSEQVQLTYRVFNLRMLLERSLTDRLWKNDARLQAVVGVQISIDPPRDARDKAAYVEITLENAYPSTTKFEEPLSLIALMPEAKTYNSAAIHTRSDAFGGAAVMGILPIGFSERRRGQTFYLYQDTDTVAIERLPKPAGTSEDAITFGWAFRPVLGRRSVAPGVRQLFAVVSLPAADVVNGKPVLLHARVKTYWRKYDRNWLTTRGKEEQVNGPNLLSREILEVYPSATYEEHMGACITHINWRGTGDATAVVTIRGENFFPGTRVVMGGKVADTSSTGLLIKSAATIELRTELKDLVFSSGFLSGRYGAGTGLDARCTRAPAANVELDLSSIGYKLRPGSQFDELTVEIQSTAPMPEDGPVIAVSGVPLNGPYKPGECSARNGFDYCRKYTALVSSTLLKEDAPVVVRLPFHGPKAVAQGLVYDPYANARITRLGGDTTITLAISGVQLQPPKRQPRETWSASLDKPYPAQRNGQLLIVQIPKLTLAAYKTLLLANNQGNAFTLPIPEDKPEPPKPSVTTKSVTVPRGSAEAVVFQGSDLNAIKSVRFADKDLAFKGERNRITIFLSPAVAAIPEDSQGPVSVDVMLESQDGTRIPARIIVQPSTKKETK